MPQQQNPAIQIAIPNFPKPNIPATTALCFYPNTYDDQASFWAYCDREGYECRYQAEEGCFRIPVLNSHTQLIHESISSDLLNMRIHGRWAA